MFQGKDLRVTVACLIHVLQGRVGGEHMLLRLQAGILYRCGGDAQPAFPIKGAQLHLRVLQDLPGHIFHLAGLDGEPAVEQIDGAEGPPPRLIALLSGEIIGSAFFQKLLDFLHGNGLLSFFSIIPQSETGSEKFSVCFPLSGSFPAQFVIWCG